MQAFESFYGMDASFWAFIRFISESFGYTDRGENTVKAYPINDIRSLCEENRINASEDTLVKAAQYSKMRADLLNKFAEKMLMDAETAKAEYQKWETLHHNSNFLCKLPLNKQKGEMRQVAFFTAIINVIAEKTIMEFTGNRSSLGFDDVPVGWFIFLMKLGGLSAHRPDDLTVLTLA